MEMTICTNHKYPIPKDLILLGIAVFILAGMPKMCFYIGGIPLYALDVLLFLAFTTKRSGHNVVLREYRIIHALLGLFGCFVLLSEIQALCRYQLFLETAYTIVQFMLRLSIFFSMTCIISSYKELMFILKAALLGLIVTSSLLILTSLPLTRDFANDYLISISILEPDGGLLAKRGFTEHYIERGIRGCSFVGAPTISGGFINTLWPVSIIIYSWPRVSRKWKVIGLIGCILTPFAAIMTYARAAVLGVLFVIFVFSTFGRNETRGSVILAVCIVFFVVYRVGWDSNLFFFERLENRTRIAIEDPLGDEDESERVLSYVEPFQQLLKNPIFFVIGAGRTENKLSQQGKIAYGKRMFQEGRLATHSAFAMAFYSFGLPAACCFVILFLYSFVIAFNNLRNMRNDSDCGHCLSLGVLGCLCGMVPFMAFGHALISQARGATLFFAVIALVQVSNRLFRSQLEREPHETRFQYVIERGLPGR